MAEWEQVQGTGGAPWLPHETTERFPYRAEQQQILVTSADFPLRRVKLFLHPRYCCHVIENKEEQLPSIFFFKLGSAKQHTSMGTDQLYGRLSEGSGLGTARSTKMRERRAEGKGNCQRQLHVALYYAQ